MDNPVHGPSFETEGGGSGAGAGSQGAGAGTPSNTGAGAGAGSQGSGSPITLSDDSLFTPPGATAPVKFGDWRKGFIPRTEHESAVKQTTNQLLTKLGQLAQQAQNAKKAAGQRQPQGQPADPWADVREMPLLDGKSAASLAERIQREGVAPLHQWAGQVNKVIQGLTKQIQSLQQGVGSVTERNSTADFHGKLDRTLASVPIAEGITLGQLEPEMQSFLREFAQDVYLSYDPRDPSLEQEFPALLKSRIEGFQRLFRALDAKKLEVAKQKRATFLKGGGNASPSGNRPTKPPSHREMAQMLFRPNAAT